MENYKGLRQRVINMDENQFQVVALEIFRYQALHNPVYREFITHLGVNVNQVNQVEDIPFLPIEMFKRESIVTENWSAETIFTSSGTGQQQPSKHYIREVKHYEEVSLRIFKAVYDAPERYHIFALLPSYLERTGSSLVHMLDHFITQSNSKLSGFYLRDYQRLATHLQDAKDDQNRKIMLWGVSFALLEMAEQLPINLAKATIIETGGMKGQREEMIRADLHHRLRSSFNCSEIQSEYGMAELTSQAYTVNGSFITPPWMKILIRDISDPFYYLPPGRVGGINVIDLANIHSCAFIETQDLGSLEENHGFTVLGRMDNSEVRGCNLLI